MSLSSLWISKRNNAYIPAMSLSFCLYNTAYKIRNYSLRQYKSKKVYVCVCVCVCVCVYTSTVWKMKEQSIEKLSFEIGLDK